MANHKQPTKEELKAQEEEAIKEAERLEKETPTEEEPQEEPVEEVEDEPSEPTPDAEGEEEETVPQEEEPEAEPSKELYKKKFSASSRENQRISAKNRVINKALADAEDVPEPTEEELVAEFRDWDIMSDTEKMLAKETVVSRNWRKVISQAKEQATKIEKWNESVEDFITDPKVLNDNPELEGKTDEFKDFATSEENNNVPFKILVSAFLHEQGKNNKPSKGKMFDRALGGQNEKPKPKNGKISLEESRKLRETDYNKWKDYNSKGMIDYDL